MKHNTLQILTNSSMFGPLTESTEQSSFALIIKAQFHITLTHTEYAHVDVDT